MTASAAWGAWAPRKRVTAVGSVVPVLAPGRAGFGPAMGPASGPSLEDHSRTDEVLTAVTAPQILLLAALLTTGGPSPSYVGLAVTDGRRA